MRVGLPEPAPGSPHAVEGALIALPESEYVKAAVTAQGGDGEGVAVFEWTRVIRCSTNQAGACVVCFRENYHLPWETPLVAAPCCCLSPLPPSGTGAIPLLLQFGGASRAARNDEHRC